MLLSAVPSNTLSQEITEENFNNTVAGVLNDYAEKIQALYGSLGNDPNSLTAARVQADERMFQKLFDVSREFISLPEALNLAYNIRIHIPKDSLRSLLDSLPDDKKYSEYGKNIQMHIDTEQIKEGDRFSDFEATGSDGNKFTLSELDGKNVLLLYGGLDCMGESGREYLKKLYGSTSKETFVIVVYVPVADPEKMKEYNDDFPSDYIVVSDFLLDSSPIKIKYGAQSTPTCFFINNNGIVDFISVGLPMSELNRLLNAKQL